MLLVSPGSKLQFLSRTSCFRVADHFKENTLNDRKVTLNITRSKVPHLCLLVSGSLNLQPIRSSTNLLHDTFHFKTLALNDARHHKVKFLNFLYICAKIQLLLLYDQRFSSYSFGISALNASERTLAAIRWNIHVCVTSAPCRKLHSVSLCGPPYLASLEFNTYPIGTHMHVCQNGIMGKFATMI